MRYRATLLLGVLMLLAATVAVSAQVQFFLPAGKAPVAVKEYKEGSLLLTRFVVEGESAENWSSALEILEIDRKGQPKTAADWYSAFRQNGDENCPGGEWTVVQQDESSVLFERATATCDGNAPQRSLNRVIYGKKKLFVLIFTTTSDLGSEDRDAWVAVLGKATAK